MMKTLMTLALLVWTTVTATVRGEETAVLVDTTVARSYILTIDAGGNVTLLPLKAVVRPGPTPPPGPPTPGPLTQRGTMMRDAAAKVTQDAQRVRTAQGLAELYRQVAKMVRTSQVTDRASLEAALKLGHDAWLNPPRSAAGTAVLWQPVRELLDKLWGQVTLTPSSTMLDYAVLLDECAVGLDASVPAAQSAKGIDPAVMDLILEIIKLILQLLHK